LLLLLLLLLLVLLLLSLLRSALRHLIDLRVVQLLLLAARGGIVVEGGRGEQPAG
jgi:hypothetical protein